MIQSFREAFRDFAYCVWCGIEMKLSRALFLRDHCKDCSQPYKYPGESRNHTFHSRVGMSER